MNYSAKSLVNELMHNVLFPGYNVFVVSEDVAFRVDALSLHLGSYSHEVNLSYMSRLLIYSLDCVCAMFLCSHDALW